VCQFRDQVRLQVLSGPAGYIIDNNRNVEVGDLRVVLHETCPVRLVIVRTDDEHPVRTDVLCCLRQPDCFCRVV